MRSYAVTEGETADPSAALGMTKERDLAPLLALSELVDEL
jgi:hypothetical protein